MAFLQVQAQLGINDTALTRALEDGDYRTSERMIIENTDPHYLNEGPYEKTPLAIVLSGDFDRRYHPRNLKIAMMLVQNGANPNLRIPQFDFDGASRSPMEEVLRFYIDLDELNDNTKPSPEITEDRRQYKDELLATIGLHDEHNLSVQALKEQVLELTEFFLGAGGDPNVTTTMSNCSLFHMVLRKEEPHIDLIRRFCDAGADINQTDVHGTTPLMDLILYCESSQAVDVAEYLWTRLKSIDVNATNCANETALWRAMFVGQPLLSVLLLQRGASGDTRASIVGNARVKAPRRKVLVEIKLATISCVSALFAPLLQDSRPYFDFSCVYSDLDYKGYKPPEYFDKVLCDKIINSCIAPLVDAGYFNTEEVSEELCRLLEAETKFPHLCDNKIVRRHALVPLMFGSLSTGLRQLCVRRLTKYILFESMPANKCLMFLKNLRGQDDDLCTSTVDNDVNTDTNDAPWSWEDNADTNKNINEETWDSNNGETAVIMNEVKEEDVCVVTHRDVVTVLNPDCLAALNKRLSLPNGMAVYFEIEAAKCQITSVLNLHESIDCEQGCEGESDESLQTGSDWNWRDEDDYDYDSTDSMYFDDDWSDYTDYSEKCASSDDEDLSVDGIVEIEKRDCSEENDISEGEIQPRSIANSEEEKKSRGSEDKSETDITSSEEPPEIQRDDYESFQNESGDTEVSRQSISRENSTTEENSDAVWERKSCSS